MLFRIPAKIYYYRLLSKRQIKRYLSYHDLSLDVHVIRRLRKFDIISPTYIQKQTYEAIRDRENIVINSETGSGKTLAYALPILQNILDKKKKNIQISRPTTIVLLPSLELCFQVGDVFRTILGMNVSLVSNQHPMKLKDTDVVVSTPQAISAYPYHVLNESETIVIDEADILIDRKVGKHGRKDPLFNFMNHFLQIKNRRHFIFVGATMPDSMNRKSRKAMPYIRAWVPDVKVVKGNEVHKLNSNIQVTFLSVEEGNKLKQFVGLIEGFAEEMEGIKILVFVNTVSKAKKLYYEMTCSESIHRLNSGVVNITDETFPQSLSRIKMAWSDKINVIHRDVSLEERLFTLQKFETSNQSILITTDISGRGLDFKDIDLVIQYDFAKNVTDIVHRTGRTGRMGKQGKVINFVTSTDSHLASAIQTYLSEGESLDRLFSRRRGFSKATRKKTETAEYF